MQIICSIKGIINVERPMQGLHDICNANFHNFFCDMSDFELHNRKTDDGIIYKFIVKEMEDFLSKICDYRQNISVVRTPYMGLNINEYRTMIIESIKKGLESDWKYLIVQPFYTDDKADPFDFNLDFLIEIASYFVESNLSILLENQCKNVNGHYVRGFCSDEVEAVNFIDKLNNLAEEKYGQRIVNGEEIPYFGFCMNTGICNLCGQNMYDFVVTLGSRIKAVILRDCNGNQDTSMLPFTCVNDNTSQTDWLNLIRGLRKIRFGGELIMDFSDTAAAFSPILKPQLLVLAKSIADYFKWQIEIESLLDKYPSRVLFGAGNMCRNYMKNYGEKYPPLFTCDNNKKIWGQTFEGLEIKNPECLKDVPSDTAIFICNVFYREIEEQLRGMGLKNPIEYFNDEYMPSFHFNRIDTVTRKSDKEED